MTSLLDPYQMHDFALPNRVVMAPMTRARSNNDATVPEFMATYYAQRASAGLIVTEGIFPSDASQSNAGAPGLVTDAQARSWMPVTRAVHANGGRIFAQIQHGGRVGHPSFFGHQPLAPSAVAVDGGVPTPTGMQPSVTPHALTVEEIAEEITIMVAAARRAIDAGFDGVELHGANGYLIQQFLSSSANIRTDNYGGSIPNRIRFAVELVEAMADAIGAHRVGLRLAPGGTAWGIAEDDLQALYQALMTELNPLGIAYVHVLDTTDVDTIGLLRNAWSGTFMVNPGGQWSKPGQADQTDQQAGQAWLDRGADLVSFGRAFLANPDLVERFRRGLDLRPAPAQELWYGGNEKGLITYPTHAYDTAS